jgi:hypothetical protein
VTASNYLLCPSAPCKKGSALIGVVKSDGRVQFLPNAMQIDDEFVDISNEGRKPEKRFRFSSKCAQLACKQWNTGKCGVVETLIQFSHSQHENMPAPDSPLPACPIRDACRWYEQRGSEACYVCAQVVTDLT